MKIGFSDEPAVWVEVIKQALLVAVLFGVKMTQEQIAGLVVLLGLIGTLIVRQNVTPPSKT